MSDERILSRLVVVGASHRTSSEATRDRLLIGEDDLPGILTRLRDAGFAEAVAMSTCARTEIFGIAADPRAARDGTVRVLAELGGFEVEELSSQTYCHEREAALRHLFRVASSLDSPVVGEPEVTGQFRESVRLADAAGFLGSSLGAVVQTANRVAKQIRTDTAIGERPVSMAACAVQVARDVQGDLARARAILVTGGEMGELIADHLRAAGLSQLTVLARSRARAEISARRYECHAGVLDDLSALLPEADIVVTSLGAGRYLFGTGNVSDALAARRRRPMLFVDAAIPSDVDPAANDLDGAFVYSLDDLERIALEGRSQRGEAAAEADAIVERGLALFARDNAERAAAPAVAALRDHFEAVRQEVLAERSGGDPAVDDATRLLVSRLLHEPSEALRKLAAEDSLAGNEAERLLRRLFDITGTDDHTKE